VASEWRWDHHTKDDDAGYEVAVQYDSGAPTVDEQPAEFDRFEALTRGLLIVPKSELDEKLDDSASSR
jgi:hypothetical protein